MTAEQCVAFLNALRVSQIRVKDNGWVEGSCPLAPWFHKHHTDHTPSFGLSIAPGTRSYFVCFACRQGSAEELVGSLELYSKGQPHEYNFARCHQILSEEQYVVPLPEYGEFNKPPQVFVEWPQFWLESFKPVQQSLEGLTYLTQRGVSPETMVQHHLKYDSKRHMVVAPYWDVFQRFAGARGRSISDAVSQKHHEYVWQGVNNTRLCWYHEQALNLPGPVVVVEGQFDCWQTVQAFPKTVANLTAKPTLEKMKKLGDCGTVIQIPDRDEAGEQSTLVYARYCRQLGLTHKILWLEDGAKDPAEACVAYLKDAIDCI